MLTFFVRKVITVKWKMRSWINVKKKRETPASLSHMCMFWLFAQYICPIVWFTVENPELICLREICASEKTSNRINLYALPLDIIERRFGVRLIAFHMRSVGLEFDLILRFAGYTSPKTAQSQKKIDSVFSPIAKVLFKLFSTGYASPGPVKARENSNKYRWWFVLFYFVCMYVFSLYSFVSILWQAIRFRYSRMEKAHRCALCALCAAKCFAFNA